MQKFVNRIDWQKATISLLTKADDPLNKAMHPCIVGGYVVSLAGNWPRAIAMERSTPSTRSSVQ
jgi:hypothetical protein